MGSEWNFCTRHFDSIELLLLGDDSALAVVDCAELSVRSGTCLSVCSQRDIVDSDMYIACQASNPQLFNAYLQRAMSHIECTPLWKGDILKYDHEEEILANISYADVTRSCSSQSYTDNWASI